MELCKTKVLKEAPGLPELQAYRLDFIESRLAELKTMAKDLDNEETSKVKSLVHTWKGFAEPYGFPMLAEFAVFFEENHNLSNINHSTYLKNIESYLLLKREIINNDLK